MRCARRARARGPRRLLRVGGPLAPCHPAPSRIRVAFAVELGCARSSTPARSSSSRPGWTSWWPPAGTNAAHRRLDVEVELVAVAFNHDASSATTDALNIRRDGDELVAVPEWQRGQIAAVAGRLLHRRHPGRTVTILARLLAPGLAGRSVQVRAVPTPTPPALTAGPRRRHGRRRRRGVEVPRRRPRAGWEPARSTSTPAVTAGSWSSSCSTRSSGSGASASFLVVVDVAGPDAGHGVVPVRRDPAPGVLAARHPDGAVAAGAVRPVQHAAAVGERARLDLCVGGGDDGPGRRRHRRHERGLRPGRAADHVRLPVRRPVGVLDAGLRLHRLPRTARPGCPGEGCS